MKPKLIRWNGEWLCIGGVLVARADDMKTAYRRWYAMRCWEV